MEPAIALPTGRFSHAYILESLSPQVREEAAARLSAALVCSDPGEKPCTRCRDCRKALAGIHPDILHIRREPDEKGRPRREIVVGQIRAVLADAVVLPNEAASKVYVFDEADQMNPSAQNALLKLLEEPPAPVRFLLCVPNAGSLLDTVRSRCVELSANAGGQRASAEASAQAEQYLRLAAENNRPELLRLTASWEKLTPEQLRALTEAGEAAAADMLCLRRDALGMDRRKLTAALELFRTAQRYLRSNVGVRHVLGLLGASWS